MKRIVANLVVGAHGEDGLTCRLHGFAMKISMSGVSRIGRLGVRRCGSEMCCELLPHSLGNRRLVPGEPFEPGMQSAFTRRGELTANRIIVLQIERA